jgi:hypothetical protein
MELYFSGLLVYGEDIGILQFGTIWQVAGMLRHRLFIWDTVTHTSKLLINSSLRLSTLQYNVKLTALAANAVHFVSSILGHPWPAKES